MLTKEYRIALPMSVEEYRIAQLYMIQKKSREESQGAGSGVEILINEPYTDGPGGNGQYTHKIYHIGSHLPGWFRAILPKSALRVEEEAWNAYPYTKTIYKCPFIERFVLEIETRYLNDGGEQENIFHLSNSENRGKVVDLLDIVKDAIPGGEYKKEEDPRIYVSRKTGRGPLTENWRQEYSEANRDPHSGKRIMCAYKLCKVEFRYWGMQSKIERFIHDVGLRKTMLRAHRQAWTWQDEWYGLQMSDIRRLEHETQMALHEKMGAFSDDEEEGRPGKQMTPTKPVAQLPVMEEHGASGRVKAANNGEQDSPRLSHLGAVRKESWGSSMKSRRSQAGEPKQNLSDWRVESIEQLQTSSSEEEDEFYDAQEDFELNLAKSNPSLFKSSSMEMLTPEDEYVDSVPPPTPDMYMYSSFDKKVEQYRHLQNTGGSHSIDMSLPCSPTMLPSTHSCKTTVLFLVLHGGSVIDTGQDVQGSKHADMGTLRATFESVIRAHYPGIHGHVALRLIPCPGICSETLHLLASLNPFSFDAQSPLSAESVVTHTTLPIGAISLFATAPPDYMDMVAQVIAKGNAIWNEFLRTDEGYGFNGQVCLLGDCIGSVMGYDALCRSHPFYQGRSSTGQYGSHNSLHETEQGGSESDSNHVHTKKKKVPTATLR